MSHTFVLLLFLVSHSIALCLCRQSVEHATQLALTSSGPMNINFTRAMMDSLTSALALLTRANATEQKTTAVAVTAASEPSAPTAAKSPTAEHEEHKEKAHAEADAEAERKGVILARDKVQLGKSKSEFSFYRIRNETECNILFSYQSAPILSDEVRLSRTTCVSIICVHNLCSPLLQSSAGAQSKPYLLTPYSDLPLRFKEAVCVRNVLQETRTLVHCACVCCRQRPRTKRQMPNTSLSNRRPMHSSDFSASR
jgi:hypothetical protein